LAKTLDELLKIRGVVAAGEFAPDGNLVNYLASMDMSRDMAAMTAQFVATVTMLFNTLAGAFSQLSKMKWVPQQGWAYTGGRLDCRGNGQLGSLRGDKQGRLQSALQGAWRESQSRTNPSLGPGPTSLDEHITNGDSDLTTR